MKKRGCLTFLIEWILAGVILTIIFSCIDKTGQSMGFIIFLSVLIGFFITIFVFAFGIVILRNKAQKEARGQREQNEQAGINRYNNIIHVEGLEAPKNCTAYATISPTTFIVNCKGKEFILDIAKIKNVDYRIVNNEKNQLRSCLAIITYESMQGEDKIFMLKDEQPSTRICADLAYMLKSKISQ